MATSSWLQLINSSRHKAMMNIFNFKVFRVLSIMSPPNSSNILSGFSFKSTDQSKVCDLCNPNGRITKPIDAECPGLPGCQHSEKTLCQICQGKRYDGQGCICNRCLGAGNRQNCGEYTCRVTRVCAVEEFCGCEKGQSRAAERDFI
jgi:hypothetical protein